MTPTSRAYVTPAVLTWARVRAGETGEHVAEKVHAHARDVSAWELGEASPTFKQATQLAKIFSVPFGYLFLPSPPVEPLPLPDFRRIGGGAAADLSPETIALLHDIILKHDQYREMVADEGQAVLSFPGKYSISSPVAEVADDIGRILHIDDDLRKRAGSTQEFMTGLSRSAEAAGILVMKSGVVAGNATRPLKVSEFRGFAISDPLAPLVFINGKDSQSAQIFTLVHELAHIWIGASGISNPRLNERPDGEQDIERFCNSVAAEVLVPRAAFAQRWNTSHAVEENLQTLSRAFRVSTVVILRRAYELGELNWQDYIVHYRREDQKFRSLESKKRSGGDFYRNLLARNGTPLTRTFVTAALEGRMLFRDAARLLNVGVPTIHKIAAHLEKQRAGKQ